MRNRAARPSPLLALVALAALTLFGAGAAEGAAATSEPTPGPTPVAIYFFWGNTCPYCHQQQAFLEQLLADHPNVVVYDYEVYAGVANRPLMMAMAAAFGRTVTGVPMTFIGDEAWTGFSVAIGRQMRDAVDRYGAYAAPDPLDRIDVELRPRFLVAADGD